MVKKILTAVLVWVIIVGVYHVYKPLPEEFSYQGEVQNVLESDVHFFRDTTYVDAAGVRQIEQEIFDEVLRMITEAQEYVLVDMFLFNDFLGAATTSHRSLSQELTDALINKKETSPDTIVQVITDPINTIYGGINSPQLVALETAGVRVILTDLTTLPDSNPLYSAPWRVFGQWWGNSTRTGYLPNPFDNQGQKLSMRSYLRLLNFKANHRKVIVADHNQDGVTGISTLITSANPHDGSSAHSNIAVRVDNALWSDVVTTETAVAELSDNTLIPPPIIPDPIAVESGEDVVSVELITEQAIKERILAEITALEFGDRLDIAMFYLAERDIIQALRTADARGVAVRLLLDPNKDAFGREKGGLPNRQVAHELVRESEGNTTIRWCDTTGEQCHSKMLIFSHGDTTTLIQGSANLARRNIDGFNLETNMVLTGASSTTVLREAQDFFNQQWNNEDGRQLSVAYEEYADSSRLKTLRYRFMEWSGLSSW
jgi:phosphatidylserine/phosphatidylglycerophosphate/cardiolipin synthase-like enzyme